MQETRVTPPVGKIDPLKEGTATRSSILAWRVPWTEKHVGYSPRGHKESDRTERLRMYMYAKPGGVEVEEAMGEGSPEPYTPGYPLPPSPWQRSPPRSLVGLVGRDHVPESVYSSGQTSNWTAFQTF